MTAAVGIRRLGEEDISECMKIFRENHKGFEHEAEICEMCMSLEESEFYVCIVEDKIVAFGSIFENLDKGCYSSNWLNVKTEYQKSKIGFNLAKFLMKQAKERGGEIAIITTEKHSLGFYEKLGFKVLMDRKDSYLLGMNL